MAKRGLRVPFIADVTDFLRGTRDVESELDDVADALDDVAREGDRATDRMERGFRESGQAAERSFRDIERDARDAFRGVGREADRGFRKVEDEAEDASSVVKDESRQSAAEFGASFQGGAEDVVQSFRDVAAAAGAELGGVGGYLVAGVAAGAGLLYAEWSKVRDKINEDARRIGDALREAFETGVDPYAVLVDELFVESRDKFAEVVALAEEFGIKSDDALRAHVGDQAALQRVLSKLQPIAASQTAQADEAERALGIITDTGGSALTRLVRGLQGGETAAEKAAGHLDAWRTYLSDIGQDGLPSVIEALRTGSIEAEKIASEARVTAGYWSDTERYVRRSGLAAPGQVRAERRYP